MIATIESIDFTSWLFRLIGAKKRKHKSATRMGKWAVTFVVLAAALLTLPLHGQQTASGDSAGTDVPVNRDLRSMIVDNAWNRDQESEVSLAKGRATLEQLVEWFLN
jgi:hypothetical protein